MDKEMTLQDIVDQCLEDSVAWFGTNALDTTFLTLCLAGEVGELANMVKKVERGSHFDEKEFKEGINEEIVDVFIYLCNLAGVRRIDLVKGYQEKRDKNEDRFGPNGYQQLRDYVANQ